MSDLFFFFLIGWTGVEKLFSEPPPEGGLDLVTNRQGKSFLGILSRDQEMLLTVARPRT